MLKSFRYVPAMLLAVAVWVATPACAVPMHGYRGGEYTRDLERRAYDNGFREGLQQGRNDARRGRDFSFTRHDEYRDADRGVRRGDGDFELYRRSFRQGFQTGYSEAFSRYARRR